LQDHKKVLKLCGNCGTIYKKVGGRRLEAIIKGILISLIVIIAGSMFGIKAVMTLYSLFGIKSIIFILGYIVLFISGITYEWQ
jgi:hypothetical protein